MNATVVRTAPVAIIGGGPVGLMLALFLDMYDIPVVLFNSESETRWHPKGSTHNSRTMEHYRRVGIADAVRTLGMPADHPRDIAYFTRLNGWELARFPMPSEQQRMQAVESTLETDQVPEPLLRANQMYVERSLLEQVRNRKNITLRFGWRVTDFSQDENGVSIQAVDVNGAGAVEYWRSGYMVGCDGGQSFVRRILGISFDGTQEAKIGFLSGRMLSSHLRIPTLHDALLADKKAWMYNVMAPGLRMLLISLNGSDEFLMMSQAKDTDEIADDAVTNATMIRRIHEGIGMHLDVSVLAHAAWSGGVALVAERFSDRRVFLAGDATHLFSPTGGFGMNTGIDGAANLAWKIAASVQGWAGASLLASYETERKPVAHRNTAAARSLTQRVSGVEVPEGIEESGENGDRTRGEFGAALQDFRGQFTSIGVELGARYDGSPIVAEDGEPPTDDPLVYRPTSVPGGRLPHLWIGSAGAADMRRRSVFDVLHAGFTLLRIGADAPKAEGFSIAAKRRGVPLKVVDVPSLAAWNLYQTRMILVRPDQHIAWRGDRMPDDAGRILDRAVGR